MSFEGIKAMIRRQSLKDRASLPPWIAEGIDRLSALGTIIAFLACCGLLYNAALVEIKFSEGKCVTARFLPD